MPKAVIDPLIPQKPITNKILFLRDEKVMLDVHLVEICGVETRVLKQAVRRNMDLFPEDFMFELTMDKIDAVVSQNVIPSNLVFQYLDELMEKNQTDNQSQKRIGFKPD